MDLHLAGQHHLLDLSPLDLRAPHSRPPPRNARRHRARDLVAPRGRGIEQRQRLVRSSAKRRSKRAINSSARSSGPAIAASVNRTSPRSFLFCRRDPLLLSATSGTISDAGSKPGPVRRVTSLGRERKPAHGDRPDTGSLRGIGHRSRPIVSAIDPPPPRSGSGPEALRCATSPSAASAARRRSGCSNTNHASSSRREAQTTALGIDLWRERQADRRQRLLATSPRALDRQLRRSSSRSRALLAQRKRAPLTSWLTQ